LSSILITDQGYVEEFLDFCQYQRSLAENTIRSYQWDLKQYFEWLESQHLELFSVKIAHVDRFIINLRKLGISIKSVNRKLYCLRAFYRWLQRIEVIQRNPLDLMQHIREPKCLPKYLTENQQEALIQASNNAFHPKLKWSAQQRQRDHLMVLLLLDCGLRVSELCRLRKEDINLEDGIARILGKGGKEREVVLSDRCLESLRGSFQSETDFILFNQQMEPLNSRSAFRMLKQIGKSAGILNVHPHLLRHTFASNLRRRGGDLLLIKEALGHSSVSTTEIYAHLGSQEYKEKLRDLIN
jgi:site-specific recombinase XerD